MHCVFDNDNTNVLHAMQTDNSFELSHLQDIDKTLLGSI